MEIALTFVLTLIVFRQKLKPVHTPSKSPEFVLIKFIKCIRADQVQQVRGGAVPGQRRRCVSSVRLFVKVARLRVPQIVYIQ